MEVPQLYSPCHTPLDELLPGTLGSWLPRLLFPVFQVPFEDSPFHGQAALLLLVRKFSFTYFSRASHHLCLCLLILPQDCFSSFLNGKTILYFLLMIIFGCAGSVLLHGIPLAVASRARSVCERRQVSHCSGFSCCRAWALGHWGLKSCGRWAQLLHGVWDLPNPGIEPMSPAWIGRRILHH